MLLYGNGSTQRWQVAPGATEAVTSELEGVGSDRTGRLPIIDPSTGEVVLAVARRHVASAVVLGGEEREHEGPGSPGLYR